MHLVQTGRQAIRNELRDPRALQGYAIAAGTVVALSAAMLLVRDSLGLLNVTLIFLLLALGLGLGLTIGTGPAAAGAILAFISFDFVFIPPYYTLSVADPDHALGLFAFLGVAIVAAILVGRVRRATDNAVREARRTTLLYELNRSLVGDAILDSLLTSIVRSVVDVYGSDSCRILVPDDESGELDVRARWPEALSGEIDRAAVVMAQHAVRSKSSAGIGTTGRRILTPHGSINLPKHRSSRPRSDVLYIPVIANNQVRGVL
ncbi:MAG: DUF4118 domain-containing protein [Thermomicrobiales bacterium]